METFSSDHITVCICTFHRPHLLRRLLNALSHQFTDQRFSFSIVVADNDASESARDVVNLFLLNTSIPVTYCVEPVQNISLARNRAIDNAKGTFIAFIDDDEYPCQTWLLSLFDTCSSYSADGVLGPVFPYFEQDPPPWVSRGRFFERATHVTGFKIGFSDMRTSNLLFKRAILDPLKSAFNAEFGSGGEDADFLRRMLRSGFMFIWCNESIVYELIPPERLTRRYLLRRALHRGNITYRFKEGRCVAVLKAFLALPAYSLSLPFCLVLGEAVFLKYLIKLSDHMGLLLAVLGITPFKTYK